jgi:hypothetical protein
MSGGKGGAVRLPIPAVLAAVDVRTVVVAPDHPDKPWRWELAAEVSSLSEGVVVRAGTQNLGQGLAAFIASAITDRSAPEWEDREDDEGPYRYVEVVSRTRGAATRARVSSEAAAALTDDGSLHRMLLAACEAAQTI